jgi:hypothetical protein
MTIDSDERELLRVSRAILESIRTKNAESVGRYLAPDFVHRTERGHRSSREQFLSGLAEAPFHIDAIEFETITTDTFASTAIVSGVQAAQVRAADGGLVRARTAFTDVFVRAGGGWLLQAATSVDL